MTGTAIEGGAVIGGAAFGGIVAGALVGMTVPTQQPFQDDVLSNQQNVIRGGLVTPDSLIAGTGPLRDPYAGLGLTGFSVTTAPNLTPEELAAIANYPNGKVSYTTVEELRAVGVNVIATP